MGHTIPGERFGPLEILADGREKSSVLHEVEVMERNAVGVRGDVKDPWRCGIMRLFCRFRCECCASVNITVLSEVL